MLPFLIFLLSLILFISFETNAIFEYGNLLKLKLPKINEYKNILHSGGQVQYLTFLRGVYSDYFIARLITCPICVSVPLSILLTILCLNILNYSLINFGGLLGYFGLKLLAKYSV